VIPGKAAWSFIRGCSQRVHQRGFHDGRGVIVEDCRFRGSQGQGAAALFKLLLAETAAEAKAETGAISAA